jgi:hypothetical protein
MSLLIISIIPGYYSCLYICRLIRVSSFQTGLTKHTPKSIVFSAGNVINLPITQNNYVINNFDFTISTMIV